MVQSLLDLCLDLDVSPPQIEVTLFESTHVHLHALEPLVDLQNFLLLLVNPLLQLLDSRHHVLDDSEILLVAELLVLKTVLLRLIYEFRT